MTFEELLVEFRALGGVAENVRLDSGPRGRGIFVIDSSKPAMLHASENVLVPADDLELRDGRLMVKVTSAVGARERAFLENLQEHFGWSAGGRDAAWQEQARWSQLPAMVVDRIQTMGLQQDFSERFRSPTEEGCARRYIRQRRITYHDRLVMMPLIDVVNHSSAVASYTLDDGIGVAGTFDREMLVSYNVSDTWTRALGYGFSERALHAYSIGIELEIFGHHIAIGREMTSAEVRDGIVYPRVHIEGTTINVPYLTLGSSRAPTLPRAVFRTIVSPRLTSEQADETFDNIAHFNRLKLLDMLRTLSEHDGPVCSMLREAALMQLETMSHGIGGRFL